MHSRGGGGNSSSSRQAAAASLFAQMAAASQAQGSVRTARAQCPFCNMQNEFQAGAGSGDDPVTMRCGHCSQNFQVALPPEFDSGSGRGASSSGSGRVRDNQLQICRRCGTMNQFPAPMPGQPPPDVLCGFCGHIAPVSQRRPRPDLESRLLEHPAISTSDSQRGPLVRVNVGGQRRLVPLSVVLALMQREAEHSNPARSADIAALPTRKVKENDNMGEQTKCAICLEAFTDGDELKTLPCLHIYHQKCIEQWLPLDNSCPVCKTPIGNALPQQQQQRRRGRGEHGT